MTRILTLTIALIATATALPASAGAAAYDGICQPSELCIFEHAGYGGQVLFDREATGACWVRDLLSHERTKASSFANRQNRVGRVFNSAGATHRLAAWGWGNLPGGFNDNVWRVSNCP
jgi:Peptidase inhibitor family I36